MLTWSWRDFEFRFYLQVIAAVGDRATIKIFCRLARQKPGVKDTALHSLGAQMDVGQH